MLRFSDEGRMVIPTREGPVGLAWTRRGVVRIVLPLRAAAAPDSVLAGLPDTLPIVERPRGVAAQVVRRLRAHLAGRNDPLTDVPLALRARSFVRTTLKARSAPAFPRCKRARRSASCW